MESDQSPDGQAARDSENSNGGARPARPISEVLLQPDFPKSALGEIVDIGGYVGTVVDVTHHSLKVRSPEGNTMSFNVAGLRKIYGPRVLPEPYREAKEPEIKSLPLRPLRESRVRETETIAPPVVPKREVISQPDFTKPVRKIHEYLRRPDYPKCVYGEHVEIAGYSGVVVEIAGRSLKVRSPTEITRSYNADALRKLYG